MNKIDFNSVGGFPLEVNDLSAMQDNYNSLQELAKAICGTSPAILSGCVVTGSTVSPGFMLINGELLPFNGGPLGTYVAVTETTSNKTFEDGISRIVFRNRRAVFSTGGTLWSAFWRVNNLKDVAVNKLYSELPTWNGTQFVYPSTVIDNIAFHPGFDYSPNEGGPIYKFTFKKTSNIVTMEGIIRVWVSTEADHNSLMPFNDDYVGTINISFKSGFVPIAQDFVSSVRIYSNKHKTGLVEFREALIQDGVFKMSGIGGYGAWTGDENSWPGPYFVEVGILTSFLV